MSKANVDVVVFVCNWDGLSCIEAAAQSRIVYPASVKVVRVSCLSRVHSGLILKAFELGAGGVMLLGCESGSCYFGKDSRLIIKEYEKTRGLLELLGLGGERLQLTRLPRGHGAAFVRQIAKFMTRIQQVCSYVQQQ